MNTRIGWFLIAFGMGVISVIVLTSRLLMPNARGAETQQPVPTRGPKVMKTPVLVELFTSEGCNSCPPADALLTQLTTDQPVKGAEVIVLSEHVDYWNHLGWRDPFSSKQFSDRQYAYSQAFGLDNVYTPQMVVNGKTEFLGSDSEQANSAISLAAKTPSVAVQIAPSKQESTGKAGNLGLDVHIGALPSVANGDTAHVLLAITEDKLDSDVKRGENEGKRLVHNGVVRQLKTLGTLSARQPFHTSATVAVESDWKQDNLSAVVFVQYKTSRLILGAGRLSLKR